MSSDKNQSLEEARFDQLLKAMANGERPASGKRAAKDGTSNPGSSGDCSGTQTPKGTSANVSSKRGRKSR